MTQDGNLPPIEEVGEALRSLAQDDSARSNMARLRDIYETVEDTIAKGVTHERVLATLNEKGFSMTLAGFRSALQRLRAEKEKNKK